MEYKAFESANRMSPGWKDVYVRHITRVPELVGKDALQVLVELLGLKVNEPPVLQSAGGLTGRVINGFTVFLEGNITLYGYITDDGLPVLGAAVGQDPDDQVLIPIQTARYRAFGTDRLRSISVLAKSEAEIPLAIADIQKNLRRSHRLRQGQADDFQVRNQADFLSTAAETTAVFGLLLAGIATVSLLVGGIGIMNIMLVSVTERTREIGVRKALGATSNNILLQFLIEAVVLCLVGGLVGVILGTGGAWALSSLGSFSTSVSSDSIVLAFVFSALVGVVFGVWPARRAATLDPIVALRYE